MGTADSVGFRGKAKRGYRMADVHQLDFLTEFEAAEFLGISLPILRKLRKDGKAPKHIKLSAITIRYRRKDLDEYVDTLTIG